MRKFAKRTPLKYMKTKTAILSALLLASAGLYAQTLRPAFEKTFSFPAKDATQGIAADENYVYAISNSSITKFTKDGDSLLTWQEKDKRLIRHFDGGIIIDGLLYCSHSNFPEVPMASSIEIFDPETLSHIKTISLGIEYGSCTWIVRGDDCWYACFAHYDKSGGTAGGELLHDVSWSQIVQFDNSFRRLQGWILPQELIEQLRPNSLSGGLFIDGKFYCTGHDAKKLFILEFPPYGMRLQWTGTIDIPFKGQGIALDPQGYLWGIDRKSHMIIKAKAKNTDWLNDAVIYQIYPSSYKDSDGNGIGDIQGVISRLDYIQSLGVGAIWFNPVFVSAWVDGGYDIKDYYRIDPRFGTNSDLVRLASECHKRNIKLLLDLVPGHTSMEHPWFKQSMESDTNQKYSDYYIWADRLPSAKDTVLLQKMLSSDNPLQNTAGKWMQSNAPRARYYMKNYFACQPSLNYGYAHPDPSRPWEQSVDAPGPKAVRQEMKDILAFWFDKGVDGFRVDMAKSLVKGDKDYSATKALWREMRSWMDSNYPGRILISEWGNPELSLDAGFNVDMCLNQRSFPIRRMYFDEKHQADGGCYFYPDAGAPSVRDLYGNSWKKSEIDDSTSAMQMLKRYYEHYALADSFSAGKGHYAMISSNHDHFRPNMGKRNSPASLKVMMAWILTQKLPILYYGDEIGMRSLAGLPSVEGSNHNGKERSGSRTPMQWDSSPNCGFSTCPPDSLYLPLCPDWTPANSYPEYLKWKKDGCKGATDDGLITVESQDGDPGSLLNWTRKLIALRKSTNAFHADASWEPIYPDSGAYPMVYRRYCHNENYIIALNPTSKALKAKIPHQEGSSAEIILSEGKVSYKTGNKEDTINMSASSVIITKINK